MINHLNSERIFLREMEETDWRDVHKYASQEEVCQYQPWGPNTEQESEEFVKQVLIDAKKNPRSRFVFAAVLNESGDMIGAGEFNIRDESNRVGEIGYIVNPQYWKKGFATDVANLLIEYGFNDLNLHRIYATCDPRNIGSSKVLEKVGMIKEGRMREDLLLKDGWRDSLLYSILEHEWVRK
jgi:RimJ/RimL family protein N-acetyltransferase